MNVVKLSDLFHLLKCQLHTVKEKSLHTPDAFYCY